MNRNDWYLKYWKEKNCMDLGTGIDYNKDRKDCKIACRPLKLELASEFQILVLLSYGHHNQHALECFTGTGANILHAMGWTLGLLFPETVKGRGEFYL